jgi:hypothetical protein
MAPDERRYTNLSTKHLETQIGLTKSADDWKVFSGMTFRI